MKQSQLIALAKLIKQEKETRDKINAIREKMGKQYKFHCWYESCNGITLDIDLPDYLAMFPNGKSELKQYTQTDGKVMGYMCWETKYVGELSKGYYLWVKAETPSQVISEPQQSATTTQQAA